MSMSDDEYEIPLQDQRVFGSGIKRKRVHFVPSSTPSTEIGASQTQTTPSVASRYLSLVLPPATSIPTSYAPARPNNTLIGNACTEVGTCAVCNLPLGREVTNSQPDTSRADSSRPHEAALAHQVCLPHSQTPSHIDRQRKGLAYLQAYGWDPDARLGLGSDGRGERFPIKVKLKDDTLGIGAILPKPVSKALPTTTKVTNLDAGKVRKLEIEEKRKWQRLQESFYRDENVERYLYG